MLQQFSLGIATVGTYIINYLLYCAKPRKEYKRNTVATSNSYSSY